MKNHFLGRHGRAFGPYSEAEITAFQESGEIRKFSWLWNSSLEKWDPIDPPPPAPKLPTQAQPESRATRHDSALPIEVIAHDGLHAIAGALRLVSEEGCELCSATPSAAPPFRLPSQIALSLLDPVSGQAVNTKVHVESARRQGHTWVYSIRWSGIPELILTHWKS